jgi:hypothetical protein
MIFFILALIVIAVIMQRWYTKNGLKGVSYRFSTSRVLTAPDETFELVTTLTNYTRRFIPYVKIIENLPPGITVHVPDVTLETGFYSNEPLCISKVYLLPKGKWKQHIPVSLPERGRYALQKTWLWGGDFLGLSENSRLITRNAEVVVYPRPLKGAYLQRIMGGFLGDISVRRFIIEDPVLTVGYREYTGREPMKDISWLKSAKTGQIMVKTHDFTTELSVSVVLNVETDIDDTEKNESVEKCLSIGHAVCQQLEDAKIKYDFFANFSTMGAEYATWKYLPEGLGTRHLYKVLEGLGRASHNVFESFESLLHRSLVKQTGTKGMIIITPGPEAHVRLLLAGRDENRAVILSAKKV